MAVLETIRAMPKLTSTVQTLGTQSGSPVPTHMGSTAMATEWAVKVGRSMKRRTLLMKKPLGYSMYGLATMCGLVFFGFALVWAYALGGSLAAVVAFFAAPITVPVFMVVCLLSGNWTLLGLAAGSFVLGAVGGGIAEGD